MEHDTFLNWITIIKKCYVFFFNLKKEHFTEPYMKEKSYSASFVTQFEAEKFPQQQRDWVSRLTEGTPRPLTKNAPLIFLFRERFFIGFTAGTWVSSPSVTFIMDNHHPCIFPVAPDTVGSNYCIINANVMCCKVQ